MNKQKMLITALFSLVLAACNNQTPSDAAASSPAVEPAKTALSSADGQISIQVDGVFADKISDAQFLPEGEKAENILLLQYDEAQDLTLLAVKSGMLASDEAAFFADLKHNIDNDKTLSNINVQTPSEHRMAYGFTSQAQDSHEYCIAAVASDKQIYTVCAMSTQLADAELSAVLSDVKTPQ